jgi:FkbM family methyltransferase
MSILSNFGAAVIADTKNGLLAVEAGDFAVGRRLLRDGEYDLEEIRWLIKICADQAGTFVVVGSHVGSLVIPLSKACQSMVAFEPDEQNHRLLQINLLLNEVKNARVIHKAVGAESGHIQMRRNLINTGNTSVATSSSSENQKIEVTTLDEEIEANEIALMVIDVEGYEWNVVAGGRSTLARTQRLYMEFAPEQLLEQGNDPEELLNKLGESFSHLYLFGAEPRPFAVEDGIQYIVSKMHRRAFLINILFSKHAI